MMLSLSTVLVALTALCSVSVAAPTSPGVLRRQAALQSCRVIPGDSNWPSETLWSQLNAEVGERLIKTVLLGSSCHDPSFSGEECARLQKGWALSETHFGSSSSVLGPFFQNASCDPFTPRDSQCRIGNYPEYAIKVQGPEDVAAGLRFAQKNNIRLIIKNTGHDLMGRSIGLGSLSLWTHYLQGINIFDFKGPTYTGKAMKMGAGTQAYQAYEAADAAGVRVVGGTCPTVGLAGGFTQGGGLSMLSQLYGLGADQVLEWEVVTADGKHLIATPTNNADLYWALSGGGPSTYAVVLSMTVKVYPDGPVSGVSMIVNQKGNSEDAFYDAVTAFHSHVPAWVDAGASSVYFLLTGTLNITPSIFTNKTKSEVEALIKPFIDQLKSLDVTYTLDITEHPTYLSFYSKYLGPLPYGFITASQTQGGRLIPRSIISSPSSNKALTSAIRTLVSYPGFQLIGVTTKPPGPPNSFNSVLPAWRTTAIGTQWTNNWNFTRSYAENAANQQVVTDKLGPLMEQATGSASGAYMNEADFQRTDYAKEFFGENYNRLKSIKTKYDPTDLFYATALVGSEAWKVEADGRLCRA